MNGEGGELWNDAVTGRIAFGASQFVVILSDVFGTFQFHLRNGLSVAALHLGIDEAGYMEDDGIVCCIRMVLVAVPV